MTYIFSGVFSSQELELPLPKDTAERVVRRIAHPQVKSGVLFPAQIKEHIDRPNQATCDLVANLKNLGISDGLWVYFCCWGGTIDAVAAAKVSHSIIDMNSYSLIEDASDEELSALFGAFGIVIDSNGYFEPFVRGYWGDQGY